jgi:hypothetical protein
MTPNYRNLGPERFFLEPPRRPSEGVPEQQDAAPHSEFRSSKQIEPEASLVGIGNQLGISLDFIFHVEFDACRGDTLYTRASPVA